MTPQTEKHFWVTNMCGTRFMTLLCCVFKVDMRVLYTHTHTHTHTHTLVVRKTYHTILLFHNQNRREKKGRGQGSINNVNGETSCPYAT